MAQVALLATAEAEHKDSTTVELAAQHEGLVRFLVRAGASRDDAEDIASEAIIRMWSRIREGLRPLSTTAYLRRIARNLLVDQVRREARDRVRAEALAARAAHSSVVADEAGSVALTVTVDRARRKLPHHYQQVLVCTLDLGMSRAETASALGLTSPGAAAVLAYRARKALIANLRSAVDPHPTTAA